MFSLLTLNVWFLFVCLFELVEFAVNCVVSIAVIQLFTSDLVTLFELVPQKVK